MPRLGSVEPSSAVLTLPDIPFFVCVCLLGREFSTGAWETKNIPAPTQKNSSPRTKNYIYTAMFRVVCWPPDFVAF